MLQKSLTGIRVSRAPLGATWVALIVLGLVACSDNDGNNAIPSGSDAGAGGIADSGAGADVGGKASSGAGGSAGSNTAAGAAGLGGATPGNDAGAAGENTAGQPAMLPCKQMPVMLGSAADFVVLAGSTVTSTGMSKLTGDLGVSPGTAVTGFPPGSVVGAKHAGDPTAAQGIADLTTAYNSAKGRTLCPVTVSGNLGGKTLAPGLYKSTTSLAVSSGDLTLDGQGDGDAIFIFQIASTLTTTAGRQIILSNGAKAANVYWQVGTSATIGTTSSFQGTIMADQAITLGTGAQLNGRALARIAAVNLDGNAIVMPAP